ncbi:carboxypeptidase-like regulatory domain-containing protein [Pseudohaliea rubra]|uniref:carboxypeptidase-like regulatory domain-containing protein n=1 Tax=Pseudohaliea rubra TaxID=475795 RepID=UPI0009FBA191|nr:carboxypeptidase-like regulatory domain-containing protein [Pseudohaliea rubra]
MTGVSPMLKKLVCSFLLLLLSASAGFAQSGVGSVQGTVIDKEAGQPLPFVQVNAFQDQQLKAWGVTNFDGDFVISSLAPGEYVIQIQFTGYTTLRQEGVVVASDRSTVLPLELSPLDGVLGEQSVAPPAAPVPATRLSRCGYWLYSWSGRA